MIGDTVYNRGILRPGKEGIVIDASGVSRSMLGPCAGDFTMRAVEYIVPGREVKDFLFRYFPSGTGYYWEFPMKGYSHIGAGSDDLGRIQRELSGYSGNRVLARNIRLSPLFDHLHRGNIVGVGEAIGTVSPITGEGIGPSLESAEILFGILKRNEEVDSIMEKYHREINLKFRRFRKLYELLLKTRQGKLFSPASLGAISAVREDFRNFGIDFSLKGLLRSFI
jgi:flavin-dependent dehydrogenase